MLVDVLQRTRANYGKKIITVVGAQFYNKVPSHIKNVNSHIEMSIG